MQNNTNIFKIIPRNRSVGYGLIAIPIIFLLMFAIGEFFEGNFSGLAHLVQIIPLVFFAFLSKTKTKFAGLSLMTIAFLLGVFYFFAMSGMSFWSRTMVELVLFLPPLLAGLFFAQLSK
jgi:hypothetical protein